MKKKSTPKSKLADSDKINHHQTFLPRSNTESKIRFRLHEDQDQDEIDSLQSTMKVDTKADKKSPTAP